MDRERKVTASPEDGVLHDSSVRALNGKDPFSEASKILLDMDEEGSPKATRVIIRRSHEFIDLLSRLIGDVMK